MTEHGDYLTHSGIPLRHAADLRAPASRLGRTIYPSCTEYSTQRIAQLTKSDQASAQADLRGRQR